MSARLTGGVVGTTLLLAALPAVCPIAAAQEPLYHFTGGARIDYFGFAVSGAGDVDRDGREDFLVGSPGADANGEDAGQAFVYSGRDGGLLWRFEGDSAGDWFGYAVAGPGDVDGDGHADLLIGDYLEDVGGVNSGNAELYSGRDGSLLYAWPGERFGDCFGYSVAGAGDVDGDTVPDVIVGAFFADRGAANTGYARVYSGADGSELYTFTGAPGDMLGGSVAGAGDVNRDGHADLVVGARFADGNGEDAGEVLVYSGADGALLYRLPGDQPFDEMGVSVAGAGDVDGDGHDDFLAGAFRNAFRGVNAGLARLYSGADGSVLHQFRGDSADTQLGWSVCGAGDANGDDVPDLLIGADRAGGGNRGGAFLYSGRDGNLLAVYAGAHAGDGLGFSLGALGDGDGDGLDDVLVGAPQADDGGLPRGCVLALPGDDLFLQVSPAVVQAGDELRVTTRGGIPGFPTITIATAVDGIPLLVTFLAPDRFLGDGTREDVIPVLPGIDPVRVQLRSLTVDQTGRIRESRDVTVEHR